MRSLTAILFLLTICLAACHKSKPDSAFRPGTYTGTFQRTNGEQASAVTLEFTGSKWSGESANSIYPALCNGTYYKKGTDSISFANACVWTTDFDWTLILNGNYTLKVKGDSVEISRTYNHFKDIYLLKKQ